MESKIDDRELADINLEHIINVCRKENFDATPLE